MAGTFDGQIRRDSALASKEIKASAHYQVMPVGGTLKGSAFAAGALVVEGQCLVREVATKKYVPYNAGGVVDDVNGDIPAGYDNPVILDQSIKFNLKDDGTNPDVIFGQALTVASVYEGQLVGVTAGFKKATPQIRYVTL